MRLTAIIALIASPAFAEDPEKSILDMDCMEAIGPIVFGPKTYSTGVTSGIILGYVIAQGGKPEDAEKIGELSAALCRQNPGYTVGDVLHTFDQD